MPAEAAAPPPAAAPAAPAAAPITIPATPGPAMLRPNPARDKLFAKIEQKASANDETAKPPAKPVEAPRPAEAPKTETETNPPETETNQTPDEAKEAPDATKQPKTETEAAKSKDAKNPWKLLEATKKERDKYRAEVEKAKAEGLAETERKEYLTRIEKAEARLKQHEEEIRFTNYAKSQEFQDKYAKPYEARWKLAMSEIGELTLPTADGGQRAVTAQDLLELVNLPLGAARARADELYGAFADDVMGHRKDIKRMADEQNQALEEAKVNGAQREKERSETMTRTQREVGEHVAQTFKSEIDTAAKDEANGEFFKPKDGDDDWNQALERGKKLSASVFTEDPQNPKLSKEEREAIVRRHAAVFNRSAAFSPMKRLIKSLRTEVAALKKENESFKASRPDAGGGTQAPTNGSGPVSARDRVFSAIEKFAGRS